MQRTGLLILLGLFVAACGQPQQVAAPTAGGDVRIDGVSILGSWNAIGAPDQPDIDADIRRGDLTRMLVFNPNGRVTLSGTDRTAGTGHVVFHGRIQGTSITFDELPGTATIRLRTVNTLELRDPGGNRTVYRRQR